MSLSSKFGKGLKGLLTNHSESTEIKKEKDIEFSNEKIQTLFEKYMVLVNQLENSPNEVKFNI
jgi:triosephosphate isomerase